MNTGYCIVGVQLADNARPGKPRISNALVFQILPGQTYVTIRFNKHHLDNITL